MPNVAGMEWVDSEVVCDFAVPVQVLEVWCRYHFGFCFIARIIRVVPQFGSRFLARIIPVSIAHCAYAAE